MNLHGRYLFLSITKIKIINSKITKILLVSKKRIIFVPECPTKLKIL